ncbi:MAG: 1-(5-phosphoribosyl)-5-[(5-phosphoribosylamino) methylideneamino]imidazole-4-carboxamide isomerase [Gemmatimonadaceae bacterium]
MIAVPAIDLRAGHCVQLVGGSYDAERVSLPDPLAVARDWARMGFARLHVVDLDAATGRGSNTDMVRSILLEAVGDTQVGGGVRSPERIEQLLADGAQRVVLGTRALENLDWLRAMAEQFPSQLIAAVDVRTRRVVTRGWSRTLPLDVLDVVDELNDLPLAALLVTAVHKEGQMKGTDLPLMGDVVDASALPIIASGGVTTMNDLRQLEDRGVAESVIGMALYTGALNARLVAMEFGSPDGGG